MSERRDSLSIRQYEAGNCQRCGQYQDALYLATLSSGGESQSMALCRACAVRLEQRVARHNAKAQQVYQGPVPQRNIQDPAQQIPQEQMWQQSEPQPKKKMPGALIAVLIFLLAIITFCGVLLFLMLGDKASEKAESESSTLTTEAVSRQDDWTAAETAADMYNAFVEEETTETGFN